jgi:hypothetical protein
MAETTSGIRTMDAQSLTRQANRVWDNIKQDIPAEFRGEFKNVVLELTGRVDYVNAGKAPREKTSYQALQASPLAQQARLVLTQIAKNIPTAKRQGLEVFQTLADRVEFAAIGVPAALSSKPATRPAKSATRTARPAMRSGSR